MKKILLLISVLISMTGGIIFYSHNKQDTPKLEQVNVSEKKAEEKVADDVESKEDETVEKEVLPKQEEVKEVQKEVKSDPKPENKNVSSASSKSETKTENKQSNSVSKEVPKETPKENNSKPSSNSTTTQPSKENNPTPSQNNTSSQPQTGGATTKFNESITGGKKEFSSESAANARGEEIKSKELDYVLDYNEEHPEAPIKPDINYFRVYPSVIDENGQYWYYLHFFCASGEGNDAKLKSMY